MLQEVTDIFKKHTHRGDTFIVAVSGGPDSMCLLHLCMQIVPKKNIVVGHLDHQIREDSEQDCDFVKEYCKKNKITFESTTKNIPAIAQKEKQTLEEAARRQRYAFLISLKEKHEARFVLTAHHSDDNVETILLHLIRGAGVHGMIGMRGFTEHILRPLLEFPKEQIMRYCTANNIPFREDETNKEPTTSRNIIRLETIPSIKKINPNFNKTILRNRMLFLDLEKELEEKARQDILLVGDDFVLKKDHFAERTITEQRSILQFLYLQRHFSTEQLSFDLIEEVRSFILESQTGKKKQFGPDILLENDYGTIYARTSKKGNEPNFSRRRLQILEKLSLATIQLRQIFLQAIQRQVFP